MKCKRHPMDMRVRVIQGTQYYGGREGEIGWVARAEEDGYQCGKCDAFVPKSKSQAGKRSRNRGNAQERKIANDTGGKRVGHHGGKTDVEAGIYNVQSKSGAFPERPWKYLQEIPREGGRIPVVVLMDAPGPGVKRRGVVVMQYEDWLDASGVKA